MKEKLLYRKRFIPMETIALKDDRILFMSEDLIITRWNTLKPRSDISGGLSAYFIPDGIKVSKIFDASGEFLHWYCDMIHTNASDDSIVFEDLLIDIVIKKDHSVHVVDLKEAADALKEQLITADLLCESLTSADLLLSKIYAGKFNEYTDILEQYEQ